MKEHLLGRYGVSVTFNVPNLFSLHIKVYFDDFDWRTNLSTEVMTDVNLEVQLKASTLYSSIDDDESSKEVDFNNEGTSLWNLENLISSANVIRNTNDIRSLNQDPL